MIVLRVKPCDHVVKLFPPIHHRADPMGWRLLSWPLFVPLGRLFCAGLLWGSSVALPAWAQNPPSPPQTPAALAPPKAKPAAPSNPNKGPSEAESTEGVGEEEEPLILLPNEVRSVPNRPRVVPPTPPSPAPAGVKPESTSPAATTPDPALSQNAPSAPTERVEANLDPQSPLREGGVAFEKIGPLTGNWGMGTSLWDHAAGRFVTQMMLRMPGYTGSRYAHIALRRALMTMAAPPSDADRLAFTNARAHLLLRMGEAEAARLIIDSVPQSIYTRQSYTVAVQAHLASLDIPGTCPLARSAIVFSPDVQWPLLVGACSALEGDEGGAVLGLDIARQEGKVNPFDLALAEQMVTALSGGGRGGTVEWSDKSVFTSYRLAAVYASGQTFPRGALLRAPAAVHGWLARSGAVDLETRWPLAWTATADGVMSGEEFSSLWALRGARMDPRMRAYRPEGMLERVFTLKAPSDRQRAFEKVLALGTGEKARLALWSVLAAPALTWPPDQGAFAPNLARALIIGGHPREALRWWPLVTLAKNPQAKAELWGLLSVANGGLPVTQALADSWASAQKGQNRKQRIAMGFAIFHALGMRVSPPLSVRLGAEPEGSIFVRLADAARRGARGEVVLLVHAALDKPWAQISPAAMEAVIRALRRVGLVAEARLIAAEALIVLGA